MKTFFKNLKYIKVDYLMNKKIFTVLILLIPIIFILSVLPIPIVSLKYWSSWQDLIETYSYNLFYGIVFLLVLTFIPDNGAWITLRRFSSREELIKYKIHFSWLLSFVNTLVICNTAYLIYVLIKYFIFPLHGTIYQSLLIYNPRFIDKVIPFYIIYVVAFFLITAIMGEVYILINQLITNKGIVLFILICCLIMDDVLGIQVIENCLSIGCYHFPVQLIVMLTCIAVIINIFDKVLSKNKDYYN